MGTGPRQAIDHPYTDYTINYGIESLGCLPLHRLKINVINNVRVVRQRSFERMMDCVYRIAIHIWRSFGGFSEIVVARSGGISEIAVARSGGFRGDGGCELVKCVIQGKVSGKRRRGRPKTSYSSNITKWTSVSTERITRETRDRAGWRRLIRCAARAADHHS